MQIIQQIKSRIKQSGGRNKAIELDLSSIAITRFNGEMTACIEKCYNLQRLILHHCQLQSLEGLPNLTLESVDLSNNHISDIDLPYLKLYTTLTSLTLTANNIGGVECFKQLGGCKQLKELWVEENEVCKVDGFRTSIFGSIKSLTCLDGKDINGNPLQQEQEYDEDEEYEDDLDEDSEEEYSHEELSDQPKKRHKKK